MSDLDAAPEIERKYDVDADIAVPTLVGFSTEDVGIEELRAVYYDTRRGDLARRRVTLRRREGGHDEGWHAKLPAAEGRTELHAPLEDGLPVALGESLAALLRRRRVWPIARIETTRTRRILHDESGRRVAELVDDLVRTTRIRGRVRDAWREWEVELLPGAAETPEGRAHIFDAVEAELLRAGARPASSVSKLARALGRTRLGGDPPLRTSTALGAVLVPLRELVDSCVDRDPAARADAPDAVHRYRVDVRRIRALLASTRDVLDRDAGDGLRRRLHRLQTELEPARDAEVRREGAESLIGSVDDPDGLLHRYVVARADAEHAAALVILRAYLSSPGYFRLLDDLDALVARPPLARRALHRSAPVLRRDLLHQARRASRRLDAADETDLETLHDGRKAVRRVRYLAEALTSGERPLFGDLVADLASAAKGLQDELGDARDAELHAERLDALAVEAAADGHDPSPILEGALRERATAAELLSRVPEARRTFDAAHAAVRAASVRALR